MKMNMHNHLTRRPPIILNYLNTIRANSLFYGNCNPLNNNNQFLQEFFRIST